MAGWRNQMLHHSGQENKKLVIYLNSIFNNDLHKDIKNGTHRVNLSCEQIEQVCRNINIEKKQIKMIRLEETTNQLAVPPHTDCTKEFHTMILPLYFVDNVYTLTYTSFYEGADTRGYKYRPSNKKYYEGEWLNDTSFYDTKKTMPDFDTTIYNAFLSYVDKEDLKGLTIDQIFRWQIGKWIKFPSHQLHSGSIFNLKKRWLIIIYKESNHL